MNTKKIPIADSDVSAAARELARAWEELGQRIKCVRYPRHLGSQLGITDGPRGYNGRPAIDDQTTLEILIEHD